MCQEVDWYRIRIENSGLHHISVVELSSLCRDLSNQVNTWLKSQSFLNIDQRLRMHLGWDDEIQFIIETNDDVLLRLPWHLWSFFENYPKAETALSGLEYQQANKQKVIPLKNEVRILAIIGDGEGINLETDEAVIKGLSNQAHVELLREPKLDELYEQLDKQWDILFFAGHSYRNGQIQLNRRDKLSLDRFKYPLAKAISNGLKLAIFNSCDGLDLARSLADLRIPQVIVMREPVPDVVAQEFLRHFLSAFSTGHSLYTSVRQARERLIILEEKYPCATWLPVIWQNPAEAPTTWKEWCGQSEPEFSVSREQRQNRPSLFGGRGLQFVLILSALATSLVVGARYLGWLQPCELWAFDQLQRMRPEEPQDRRILVVGITDDDFHLTAELDQGEHDKKSSLSDRALALILRKLEQNKARAIGLDIYHDFRTRSIPIIIGRKKNQDVTISLSEFMRQDNKLFAICKAIDPTTSNLGISAPDEIPSNRRDFSDIQLDPSDILRRHLLEMKPRAGSPCKAEMSLSLNLALYYLETHNPPIHLKKLPGGEFQIGNVSIKRLRPHTGVYHTVDTWGYQTLLNYRSYEKSPLDAVPQVSLKQMLSEDVKFEDIRDKIILIGVTSPNARDYIGTPYSSVGNNSKEMPGVVAQAQMISQILSAVLNHRPLLWFWPAWGDIIWISMWSLWGGFLGGKLRQPLVLILFVTVSGGVLCASCFYFLSSEGYWVPLVPSALVLLATSGSMAVLRLS